MIHSPRTFKLGLGLLLAAGLVSMPVLTGASERDGKKASAEIAKEARANEEAANQKLAAAGKSAKQQPSTESMMRRLASAKSTSKTTSKSKTASKGNGKSPGAEELARERIAKVESEAKKLAAKLTPSQKTKLLALLNDARSSQLTEIAGIGKSRSSAIEKARPIETIEDLRKVKGFGIKTLADVVDHGRSLTTRKTSKTKPSPPKPSTDSNGKKAAESQSKTKGKA